MLSISVRVALLFSQLRVCSRLRAQPRVFVHCMDEFSDEFHDIDCGNLWYYDCIGFDLDLWCLLYMKSETLS